MTELYKPIFQGFPPLEYQVFKLYGRKKAITEIDSSLRTREVRVGIFIIFLKLQTSRACRGAAKNHAGGPSWPLTQALIYTRCWMVSVLMFVFFCLLNYMAMRLVTFLIYLKRSEEWCELINIPASGFLTITFRTVSKA